MNQRLPILFFVFFFSVITSFGQLFFVGTYTSASTESEGIYLCEFNSSSEEINLIKSFGEIENPSFLIVSKDKRFLYAVAEVRKGMMRGGGYVVAYRIENNGSLIELNRQSTHGFSPCHVDITRDGKFVAAANYYSGSLALFPVNEDGSLNEASSTVQNVGSGPDEKRQKSAHAHAIKFSPFSDEVFSPDLGTDQLDIFHLEKNKIVRPDQPYFKMKPGAGPRHIEFHPIHQLVYVINELNSTVTSLVNENGKWVEFQTISTLPEAFEYHNQCADIHISKDGKYLYGSNRGHNSIVTYEVNKKGKLKTKEITSVEGDWPRNFSLTPDGNHLLVANKKTNNITIFRLEKGLPVFTGKEIELPNPVCIEFFKK